MWATLTTTPRYALRKEQLQMETWTPYTWSFANSKCGGGMWVPQSKFFSQFISCLGIGVCPSILLYKKWWWKERERDCHGDNIDSINKNAVVSTLNVMLLTLNKALPGGRPRITRYKLIPISLRIMLNHASMLPLSVLVCFGLNVCGAQHIHRRFKSSMVLGLKCPLQSN